MLALYIYIHNVVETIMNYSFGNGKHITYENGDLGDGLFIVLTALIEMNDWNVDNSHYHSLSICTIGHGFIVYYSKCTIHSCSICNIASHGPRTETR